MSEVRTQGEYAPPEYPPVEGPLLGFNSIEEELQFRRAQEKHDRDDVERLTAFALRVEPVCRNCIHAGPASVSGNDPYGGEWGSCQKGAPIAGPETRLGHYDNVSIGRSAQWPSVRHDESCGSFKLRPLQERPATVRAFKVKWAWQDKNE